MFSKYTVKVVAQHKPGVAPVTTTCRGRLGLLLLMTRFSWILVRTYENWGCKIQLTVDRNLHIYSLHYPDGRYKILMTVEVLDSKGNSIVH